MPRTASKILSVSELKAATSAAKAEVKAAEKAAKEVEKELNFKV